MAQESNKTLKVIEKYRSGGKLHISVVEGDIPISVFYSGVNVHDSALALIKEEKDKFKYFNFTPSSDIHHYNQLRMVERVNKYLKDDFVCNKDLLSRSYQSSFCSCILNFIYLHPSEFKVAITLTNKGTKKN